ncbi:creatininase family protein [Oscillibacter sp. MSJ-2]|uniref:Creatininase family protein n=1 Tax=Dysosmobacter acutus TaxID=2841504 RepID=A0ABS6F5G1_9FIRM|nr:creatininase family protein [Dysosmobacter acutus]MBU5625533.1 creatininase family protein [Dysosmobacter acutus]
MSQMFLEQTMLGMTWEEVEEAARRRAVVLLPVGVVEAHGPHLPLGTDIYTSVIQAFAVMESWKREGISSLVAPPFYWGGIQALTRQFPGSFTASRETIVRLVKEILESLDRAGFERVVFFNVHGDNFHQEAMMEAVRSANKELSLRAYWPVYENELSRRGLRGDEDFAIVLHFEEEDFYTVQREGSDGFDVHAGAFETAAMRELIPELVRETAIPSLKPTQLRGEQIGKWRSGNREDRDLIPQGYCGDPALSAYLRYDAERHHACLARALALALNLPGGERL